MKFCQKRSFYYFCPHLSKISLPFQVQLSKIHMVYKIKKIRKHLYRQAPHTHTHFAEKITTIYAIVLLSIRFFVPITLELKTTFSQINPTLLCDSSTDTSFFGDQPFFFQITSLSQKCSLKCVVFQELFRLIF